MGPYLSAPNSKKHSLMGNNKELRYVSTEMQGRAGSMQDGGTRWKTP